MQVLIIKNAASDKNGIFINPNHFTFVIQETPVAHGAKASEITPVVKR